MGGKPNGPHTGQLVKQHALIVRGKERVSGGGKTAASYTGEEIFALSRIFGITATKKKQI